MDILSEIMASKRSGLETEKRALPLDELRDDGSIVLARTPEPMRFEMH